MALQMTTLQGTLRGPNNVALAGATLRFVLSHAAADLASNTALVRTPVDVVSNDEGAVSVDLWPNDNGFNNTYYDVRAYTTDKNGIVSTYEFGQVQVPTVGPVDLADLLQEGVLRALGVEEQVLQGAIRAETAAQTAEASAATYNEAALEGRLNQRVDDWTSEAETAVDDYLANADENFDERIPLPPNILANTLMDDVDETGDVPVPVGYTGVAVTLEAVHPFTKGFEGVYEATQPGNAVTDPDLATEANPLFNRRIRHRAAHDQRWHAVRLGCPWSRQYPQNHR